VRDSKSTISMNLSMSPTGTSCVMGFPSLSRTGCPARSTHGDGADLRPAVWGERPVILRGLHETDGSPFEHLASEGFSLDLSDSFLGSAGEPTALCFACRSGDCHGRTSDAARAVRGQVSRTPEADAKGTIRGELSLSPEFRHTGGRCIP
jgi:hypothetical protein